MSGQEGGSEGIPGTEMKRWDKTGKTGKRQGEYGLRMRETASVRKRERRTERPELFSHIHIVIHRTRPGSTTVFPHTSHCLMGLLKFMGDVTDNLVFLLLI